MTNEELAARIQRGERECILELWDGVRRFAWKQAKRWAAYGGIEVEDLLQVAFLALLDAVDGWKTESEGSFIAWYFLRLKGHFTVATGRRTMRDRMDPLHSALSLDATLTEDESDPFTLSDIVPDPAAEAAFLSVEDLERRAAVEAAIASLTASQQAAIRARYYKGQTLATQERQEEAKALRALRQPQISRKLRQYL